MSYLFYLGVSLILILVQTTILPYLFHFGIFYDLFVPFVLYLVIFRPAHESFVTVVLLGMAMDAFSAGPMGLYGAAYLCLFALGIWLKRYLHVGNRLLLPVIVTMGVVTQNLLLLIALVAFDLLYDLPRTALARMAYQVMLALLTGAPIMMAIRRAHKWWFRWWARFSSRQGSPRMSSS